MRAASSSARPYSGSLWYYLPAALLVKTPLGHARAVAGRCGRDGGGAAGCGRRRRTCWSPTAVLLAVAMTGARNFGIRYAIFVPMFLAVAAAARGRAAVAVGAGRGRRRWCCSSRSARCGRSRTTCRTPTRRSAGRRRPTCTCTTRTSTGARTWAGWPTACGERYPGERVWLVYKGSGVPSVLRHRRGRPAHGAARAQVRGLLVVSDSPIAKADEPAGGADRQQPRRSTQVGHSITIYRR